jgi:tRNA modification GTPase
MTGAADTIAAIATPPGMGGVGIVRISGALAPHVAQGMLGRTPRPRLATLSVFRNGDGETIDQGIALFFPQPHSFTGEDVLELQGHGGPVVLDLLLRRALDLGARIARPGEFSERAFLNGKLDLLQAEAIADLIASGTEHAARLAMRTLDGALSRRVRALAEDLTGMRTELEAALDFPDEELDLIGHAQIPGRIDRLITAAEAVKAAAHQGRLIREGINLVIAGPPNAGKSSLLNALSGMDAAIVTDIPGTTRDVLREQIQIDGMPVHIIDTAGLRHSLDPIEQEGMRRARDQIERADRVLWVFDGSLDPQLAAFDPAFLPAGVPVTFVRNKIDLVDAPPGERATPAGPEIALCARDGSGLDLLRAHLKAIAGFQGAGEGELLARRRHLDALERCLAHLTEAATTLQRAAGPELVAEDLRLAHQALGEITGEVTSDDLLGRIFSTFCIGK